MHTSFIASLLLAGRVLLILATVLGSFGAVAAPAQSWTADNGNGTYSNPLFYEEFEDPDVIRVGDDYYLAGTTMHMIPALIVLHSRDLVNWELASYCMARLDLGPAFRLEGGNIYGRGIWAPCIRHHDGVFYVFSNVNGVGCQLFRSKSPNGPWRRDQLPGMHDLSVLFEDDGKIYAIFGALRPKNSWPSGLRPELWRARTPQTLLALIRRREDHADLAVRLSWDRTTSRRFQNHLPVSTPNATTSRPESWR
jgi:hypothetical protein